MNFPVLTSSRLVLREHCLSDKNDYYRLYSNIEAIRYYGRLPINSIREAELEIKSWHTRFAKCETIKWAVEIINGKKFIGNVGIKDFTNCEHRGTISCIISPEAWGYGYAQEAIQSIMCYSFNVLKLHRLQALVDPKNERAMSLFRHLGFHLEAILRQYELENNAYIDIALWSIINLKL